MDQAIKRANCVYLSGWIDIGTWKCPENSAVWAAVRQIVDDGGEALINTSWGPGTWDCIRLAEGKSLDDYGLQYEPGNPGACASLRMNKAWRDSHDLC